MKEYLFNLHDVFLLFTFLTGVMLATLQPHLSKDRRIAVFFLGAFFLDVAMYSLDTLLIWNQNVRAHIAWDLRYLFDLSDSAQVFQGLLMYFYTRSRVTRDEIPNFYRSPHLYIALVICTLGVINNSLVHCDPCSSMAVIYANTSENWHLREFILQLVRHTFSLIYGGLTLHLLLRYRQAILNSESDPTLDDSKYLMILVSGFLAIWLIRLGSNFVAAAMNEEVADLLGITSNYVSFVLLVSLFVLGLKESKIKIEDVQPQESLKALDDERLNAYLKKITQVIDDRKIHLETNINVERFSAAAGVPPRALSAILNQYLGANFFEFINKHRVEAAKEMLLNPVYKDKQIIDIQLECGFNSKSAFNRFFKKFEGSSPSEYRRRHLPAA